MHDFSLHAVLLLPDGATTRIGPSPPRRTQVCIESIVSFSDVMAIAAARALAKAINTLLRDRR